jgi:hypothetical protein
LLLSCATEWFIVKIVIMGFNQPQKNVVVSEVRTGFVTELRGTQTTTFQGIFITA